MAGLTTLPKAGTILTVGIGEVQVTADRHSILVSYGLGSCVALCLWDSTRPAAGMAHVMLPVTTTPAAPSSTPAKFADHTLDALLAELGRLRVDRGRRYGETVLPDGWPFMWPGNPKVPVPVFVNGTNNAYVQYRT